ncbi:MAG: helix-turn-helix domain-containing protein [Firmicutes bacterium]|nr:helix-turn-helix domain-containing protein [Bacillota bacterium]
MIDRIALGAAIRAARLKKGYTQEQLAELVEVTPTHEKHIESGHRLPSVEVLFSIAQALDLSLDNVIFPEQDTGSGRAREIQIMLNQCEECELAVLLDVARSLIKNRD